MASSSKLFRNSKTQTPFLIAISIISGTVTARKKGNDASQPQSITKVTTNSELLPPTQITVPYSIPPLYSTKLCRGIHTWQTLPNAISPLTMKTFLQKRIETLPSLFQDDWYEKISCIDRCIVQKERRRNHTMTHLKPHSWWPINWPGLSFGLTS